MTAGFWKKLSLLSFLPILILPFLVASCTEKNPISYEKDFILEKNLTYFTLIPEYKKESRKIFKNDIKSDYNVEFKNFEIVKGAFSHYEENESLKYIPISETEKNDVLNKLKIEKNTDVNNYNLSIDEGILQGIYQVKLNFDIEKDENIQNISFITNIRVEYRSIEIPEPTWPQVDLFQNQIMNNFDFSDSDSSISKLSTNFIETSSTLINLNTVSTNGAGYTYALNGNIKTITINTNGNYKFFGTFANGNILVNTNSAHLFFNGVSITSPKNLTPLSFSGNGIVTLVDGTENYFETDSTSNNLKAAIYSSGNFLAFNGSGKINVTSLSANGVFADKNLFLLGGGLEC